MVGCRPESAEVIARGFRQVEHGASPISVRGLYAQGTPRLARGGPSCFASLANEVFVPRIPGAWWSRARLSAYLRLALHAATLIEPARPPLGTRCDAPTTARRSPPLAPWSAAESPGTVLG